MSPETLIQNTEKKIIINDTLKNAVIENFRHCGIEMEKNQLDISILEVSCDFGSHIDNPEPLQFNIVTSSSLFFGNVSGYIEVLKKSLDDVDQNQKDFEEGLIQEESDQTFENQREECLLNFCKTIETPFPIHLEKNLDHDGNRKLFILVDLKDPDWEYKGMLEWFFSEIIPKIKNYNEFRQDSTYDYFFAKFSNQTMLFGNYVDYYLNKNALPDAELLTELSAAKYEGSESEARIYFDKSGIEEVSKINRIGRKSRIINSQNKRVIRKLMEISKRGQLFLYAEKEKLHNNRVITMLVKEKPDQAKASGLYIKFSGFLSWRVIHGAREEIIYHHGKYLLNSSKQDRLYLDKIERVKKKLTKTAAQNPQLQQLINIWVNTNKLEDLVKILEKQKHGTIVIVTNCEQEAKRLCKMNRGTFLSIDKGECLDCNVWNEEQLLSMTSIDGALFMNLNGQCLAMGVLMDGIATKSGDVGRGARYNSTANYIAQKKDGIYFGIIVSEDGMIDLVWN